MSRYLEVFAEISEILESEDYEPERFQEMCYELAKELDVVREVVHACAAGPWCYDVANAPFGEWIIVMLPVGWRRALRSSIGWVTDAGETCHPIAFAEFNPPETKNG